MKLIELCQYTLKQSLNDTGEYYEPKQAAQDIIDNLNKKENKNANT